VLTSVSLVVVGDRPWDVEELLTDPSRFEGERVVMSHVIQGVNLTDPVQVAFAMDEKTLYLPLTFPDEVELPLGRVITFRGVSRIASAGTIVVEEYHVADSWPKALLGLVGAGLFAVYFLRRFQLNWRDAIWERKELA
jgi:hypothetical protein